MIELIGRSEDFMGLYEHEEWDQVEVISDHHWIYADYMYDFPETLDEAQQEFGNFQPQKRHLMFKTNSTDPYTIEILRIILRTLQDNNKIGQGILMRPEVK